MTNGRHIVEESAEWRFKIKEKKTTTDKARKKVNKTAVLETTEQLILILISSNMVDNV